MTKESLLRTITEKPVEQVYVFGSWLSSERPNDLDVLITYDSLYCSPAEVIEYSDEIAEAIEQFSGLPVDLVRLSLVEATETDFVRLEGCVAIETALSDYRAG